MRARNKLSVKKIAAEPPGKLQDGGGLILDKAADGGKWIYRYSLGGRRREMGLGAWPAVSLSQARAQRDRWAACLVEGRDPITERQRLIEAERAEMDRRDPTLSEVVDMVFAARKGGLRGDGTRGRWLSPLTLHVMPKLGKRRISALHQTDIRDALQPIWKSKHETAQKAISRLSIIFRQAKLAGMPVDPFTVEAARHLLGPVVIDRQPIAATPWQDIPALYARLGERPTVAHLCLQWLILTAVRQDAGRGARLDEIDGDVWTVPADRIKGTAGRARDFRVPLSPQAVALAQACEPLAIGGQMFPGNRSRLHAVAAITDTATQKALNELGEAGRPHGFRTSFRTWVQDTESASFDVAETALGHIIGGRVERSYARSDLLDARRVLMCRWADYVTGTQASSNVVPLRADQGRSG